jgi:hypothetical protein
MNEEECVLMVYVMEINVRCRIDEEFSFQADFVASKKIREKSLRTDGDPYGP